VGGCQESDVAHPRWGRTAIKKPRLSETIYTDQLKQKPNKTETWTNLDGDDHIVGVVDYGNQPSPYVAMEYINGGQLGSRSGEMELRQAF
jgi:serine/threonine protein kinase